MMVAREIVAYENPAVPDWNRTGAVQACAAIIQRALDQARAPQAAEFEEWLTEACDMVTDDERDELKAAWDAGRAARSADLAVRPDSDLAILARYLRRALDEVSLSAHSMSDPTQLQRERQQGVTDAYAAVNRVLKGAGADDGDGWVNTSEWDHKLPQPWQAYCPKAKGRKVFYVWWFSTDPELYRDALGCGVVATHLRPLPAPPA